MGFMLNTSFLSMWISNLAATALMLPIVDAVLVQLRHRTKSIVSISPSAKREHKIKYYLREFTKKFSN